MKSADLIKMVRDDFKMMWNKHLKYIETQGQEGMPCLDVPFMERLMARTDEEILDHALSKGVYIIDKEEYLQKIKEVGI
jgi:hypothetical protein